MMMMILITRTTIVMMMVTKSLKEYEKADYFESQQGE
jgi:hypothetical protein